jgi:hypothetical protein
MTPQASSCIKRYIKIVQVCFVLSQFLPPISYCLHIANSSTSTIMFAEDTITPELSNVPELSDPDELRDALDSVVAYVILQLYIQITAQHDCSFKKVLQPYRAQARWIAPAIHPFMDLTRAFFAGVPEVGAAEEEEQDGYVVISHLWVETVY